MDTAAIFTNGRSQAVRLPKAYRFRARKVHIAKLDDLVILAPPGKQWDILERSLGMFTPDFMAERQQPRNIRRRKKL
jgi:antitoxin VapB